MAGVGSFYAQKRQRTASPKVGAGLRIQIEIFEGGIVNASCEKNDGLRNMILKPEGFKWVQSLGVWQTNALIQWEQRPVGNDALVRSVRARCESDGVELTVIDRAQPTPKVSIAELMRLEDERHQQAVAAIQSGASQDSSCSTPQSTPPSSQVAAAPFTPQWHAPSPPYPPPQPMYTPPQPLYTPQQPMYAPPQPLYTALPSLAAVAPLAHAPAPHSPKLLDDGDDAFNAALTSIDEQALIGGSQPQAPSQGVSQAASQQGASQGPSQALPGTPATAAPSSASAAPQAQSNLTAEQQQRMELNRQRALALRAQRRAQG